MRIEEGNEVIPYLVNVTYHGKRIRVAHTNTGTHKKRRFLSEFYFTSIVRVIMFCFQKYATTSRNRGFARRGTHIYEHDFVLLLGFLCIEKQNKTKQSKTNKTKQKTCCYF